MKFYNLEMKIPVTDEVDVLVAGGGTAGVFAAIAASMAGAKTMLIEKNGKLGGTMTCGGVNFPGLFYAWGRQIISGPCWDSVLRAVEEDNLTLPEFVKKPERHWHQQIRINVFTYTAILDEMCREAGCDVKLHTVVSHAKETDDGVIVICTSQSGMWAVKSKTVIDATGDAGVAAIMGYERMRSESRQPATLINNIGGYDIQNVDEKVVEKKINDALLDGILRNEDIHGGSVYHQLKEKRLSMHITDADSKALNNRTVTEFRARQVLHRTVSILKTVPGLENLYVTYAAEECGIRETYRILGETVVNAENYLSGYMYEDAVSYAFYPIDLHVPTGIKQVFLEEDVVPTIPYTALVPKNSKKLLVAGRCISSDTDANSALRVQAPCMSMGQVAGIAAGIAAKDKLSVKDVPVEQIKKGLKEIGAIVPEV